MRCHNDCPLAVFQRRRAMRLACWNGAIWAIGNGLASSPLMLYLVMDLEVSRIGLGIAILLAAPHLVGLLRLGAPALIGRLAGRKPFCVTAFLVSGLVLAAVPLAAAPGWLRSPGDSLAAMVALWCAYHLLEYLGMVALWSWLADVAPQQIRGRFLGRRERWMVAGQAAGMLASGLFVWRFQQTWPGLSRWIGYAIPALLGAGFVVGAVVPLMRMPHASAGPARSGGATLRAMLAPVADRAFLRLLAFGCWLALLNGLLQSPQNYFPYRVLGMSLLTMLALKVGLRLGQWPISPRLGRLADRLGNRPVLGISLLVVAQGPLFYFLATPEAPWWIVGAWVCWIAWAGLNIAMPNLMLKLSPPGANTSYIATWFAVTELCLGASTILGGELFDRLHGRTLTWLGITVDYCHGVFLFGWITLMLGVVVLFAVVREGPQGVPPCADGSNRAGGQAVRG